MLKVKRIGEKFKQFLANFQNSIDEKWQKVAVFLYCLKMGFQEFIIVKKQTDLLIFTLNLA